MRKLLLLLLLLIFWTNITASSNIKVAVVYSIGGLGDEGYNDLVHKGLNEAKKELGIDFDYYEPADPTKESEQQLKNYAESGEYELILTVGFSVKDSLVKIAQEYPEQRFAIIDEVVDNADNIISITFNVEDESFLAGIVAGLKTKTGNVGFIGGSESPLITKYESGFKKGAKYINKDIKVLVSYLGGYNAFYNPKLAEEKTNVLIKKNADVFYHAAGASGQGVINSAKKNGKYVIGVDSDQNWMDEEVVLASAVKNIDIAVYDIIKKLADRTLENKIYIYGLDEGGVGLVLGKKEIIGRENAEKIKEIEIKKVKY